MNKLIMYDYHAQQWLQFQQPSTIIQSHQLEELRPHLQEVEQWVNHQPGYAAGFLSYEAAPAFDPALTTHAPTDFPLLWFALFEHPPQPIDPPTLPPIYPLTWRPSVSEQAYGEAIAHIKEAIARGDTYQVNYSFRLWAEFQADSEAIFWQLMQTQQANYGAYLDIGDYVICSASPELFFQLDGSRLLSRPMKGTASRGLTLPTDEAQAAWLRQSTKNRAENVMIVDMLRNDIGRVAEVGTVAARTLFDVERYPTLWQMTSTVQAETQASVSDIMAALFPCASITGAPKTRTMQLIQQLEETPRRIYTGCIGWLAPQRQATFNVAIRTLLIDRRRGQAEYGVGGGVVWDSETQAEYAECILKANVLQKPRPRFELLESMLWTPAEGYFLLEYHLRRLRQSAIYFGYQVDGIAIERQLHHLTVELPSQPHKVRLLLAQDGTMTSEALPLTEAELSLPTARLRLSPTPVDSQNPFIYHKTTARQMYAIKQAYPAYDDILLWNERGDLTESCTANVVVQLEGQRYTPPVESGLLAGTFRAWLLDNQMVREKIITKTMLFAAEKVWVINSVRKWRAAVVEEL